MNGYAAHPARRSPAAKPRSLDFRTIATIATLIVAQLLQLGSLVLWAFMMFVWLLAAGGLRAKGFAEALTLVLIMTYPLWLLYGGVVSWVLFYARMRVGALAVAALFTAPTLCALGWILLSLLMAGIVGGISGLVHTLSGVGY